MGTETRGAAGAWSAWLTLLVSFAVLADVGCGYRVVGYSSPEQPELRVSIQTLGNDSLEPGVELMVSEALRHQFLRAGRLRLVEDTGAADYRVSGRIEPLQTQTRSFTPGVRAVEFTVSMSLRLNVDARDGGRLALDRFVLRESEIYLASADIEISRKNRDEALRRLAELLAERVYDEMEFLTNSQQPGGGTGS